MGNMQVRGIATAPIPVFIKNKFGDEAFSKWLGALSPEAKAVFSEVVFPHKWYPVTSIFVKPIQVMCDLFFNKDLKGSWELGRFVAEQGVKGGAKLFFMVMSPHFLISKASSIMSTYYSAGSIEIPEKGDKFTLVRISGFSDMDRVIEFNIGGWIERALEITGCKEVSVKITKSISQQSSCTEYRVSWK